MLKKMFPINTYTRFISCLGFGLIGAFGMGPFYIWLAMLLSLSLFWVIFTGFADDKKWKSFLCGFLYGFGFFCGGMWWIGNALLVGGSPFKWAYPLAVCGLPVLFALFTMLAIGLIRIFAAGRSLKSYLIFILFFFLFELARGTLFTGFPWNLTGMTWTNNLPILQFLSIGGISALSAISIFILSTAGFMWKGNAGKIIKTTVLISAIGIFIALNIYGTNRLNSNPTIYNRDVIIQMIQPNIAQEYKWDANMVWDNYRQLLSLMKPDAQAIYPTQPKTRLVVMPETAVTFYELGNIDARTALINKLQGYSEENVYLLTGALLKDGEGYHNSLIALDNSGNLLQKFDKFHLVPFGEYIPFQKYIPIAPVVKFTGFKQGDGPHTLFMTNAPSFSPLVCYEVIFTGRVVANNEPRPEWLVNVTNDAWYGISPGPIQHLAQAQYRAIEEGIPMVRVANTGISAIFDAYGRMIVNTGLFVEGAPEHHLPKPTPAVTFYSRLF